MDTSGDVEMKHKQIQMIEGDEVVRQRIWSVLSTNKGEWVLNPDEGINFRNILGKRKTPVDTEDSTLQKYYEDKISDIKEDTSALTKRLERRLEGLTNE